MLRSIGEQSGESVVSVLKKKEGYGGKDLHEGKVLSLEWKVRGDWWWEWWEMEVPQIY